MSRPVSRWTRVIQLAALVVTWALLLVLTRTAPGDGGPGGAIVGLGFLLLAGTLTSELGEALSVPHLTSYIAVGFVAGPSLLGVVDQESVGRLSRVDTLAISLIALAGGCELKIEMLKKTIRSVLWSTLFQSTMVFLASGAAFMALGRFIPFAARLDFVGAVGAAVLWGSISITRSPAALLGILAQTRAKGPLTTFSVSFVMLSDVVVIVVVGIAIVFARPMLDARAELSFANLGHLGRDMVGSVALGMTLGIILAVYLRVVGEQLFIVLVGLGLGLSEFLRYIEFDSLLAFIVAGFVVENFSNQGPKLLASVARMSTVVFVAFFALAGAHLDLELLKKLWPIALALGSVRALVTVGASKLASRVANDAPVVRRWAWSSMISQAGVTLGLTLVIARAFPALADEFRNLAIAVLSLNEVIGPVFFKLALDRVGESAPGPTELAVEGGRGSH